MTSLTRPKDRIWAQGFFLGLVSGFVSVWLGLAGVSLLLALAAALSLNGTRSHQNHAFLPVSQKVRGPIPRPRHSLALTGAPRAPIVRA